MLLVFPRFMDWVGGASLLGLGDIVLPGFLVSLAARVDGTQKHASTVSLFRGYFCWAQVGYIVGLLLAAVAAQTVGAQVGVARTW